MCFFIVRAKQHSSSKKEILGKYEILDGNPDAGMSIPFRIYLEATAESLSQRKRASPLTPTYKAFPGAFHVDYFLCFAIFDYGSRRFFKEQKIELVKP